MRHLVNISVVIYKSFPQGLQAMLEQLARLEAVHTVYVIDNSPQAHTLPQGSALEYVFNGGKNLGYGAAHNIAMRATLAQQVPYHLVMNPDIELSQDALECMLQRIEEDERVGLLMPRVLSAEGEVQRLCKLLPSPIDLLSRRFAPRYYVRHRAYRFEMRFADYSQEMCVPYLSGCFMLLRSSVLRGVGLFDERFFLYPEDVDLSRRMYAVARNLYFPSATVVHQHERASYKSVAMLLCHAWNMCKYFFKWGWWSDAERRRVNNEIVSNYNL